MIIDVKPMPAGDIDLSADLITLTNSRGESVSLCNYGAHIVSVRVLDQTGQLGEVCLGQDTLAGYAIGDKGYMGATIGRYGNRIAGAGFEMDGIRYLLHANNGPNTLHGGREGFDKRRFSYTLGEGSVTMRYVSPHLEEGFPGNLDTQVTFSFNDQAELRIDYHAVSDQDTQINLTNHVYFNLGDGADILDHHLQILADRVVEVDDALIPTGHLIPVEGTPFDLRQPQLLKDMMARTDNAMFNNAKGFDIGYVLQGEGMREIATFSLEDTGRTMRVLTDQPGVQCYSGQMFNCSGRGGRHYGPYAGLALETQQHPDTVHHPAFGSTRLQAGDVYQTSTVYAFSAAE